MLKVFFYYKIYVGLNTELVNVVRHFQSKLISFTKCNKLWVQFEEVVP